MITIVSLVPGYVLPEPKPSAYNPHQVYLLRVECNKLPYPVYKIGVSTQLPKRLFNLCSTEKKSSRVKGRGHIITLTVLDTLWVDDCHQASYLEHLIMDTHIKYKYTGKYILPSGNSELFWCLPGLSYVQYGRVIEIPGLVCSSALCLGKFGM